jgi:hypothetical protein
MAEKRPCSPSEDHIRKKLKSNKAGFPDNPTYDQREFGAQLVDLLRNASLIASRLQFSQAPSLGLLINEVGSVGLPLSSLYAYLIDMKYPVLNPGPEDFQIQNSKWHDTVKDLMPTIAADLGIDICPEMIEAKPTNLLLQSKGRQLTIVFVWDNPRRMLIADERD